MNKNDIVDSIKNVKGRTKSTNKDAEVTYDALNKYGIDLVQMAGDGKLDPVIGRDDEIRRVIQVLSRRTKNNPVLIGEPGVGKTAVVEGLAQRIIAGDVPDTLKSTIFFQDEASVAVLNTEAGEERLKTVLKEIKDNENIILTR